jgi:hypothetical protein
LYFVLNLVRKRFYERVNLVDEQVDEPSKDHLNISRRRQRAIIYKNKQREEKKKKRIETRSNTEKVNKKLKSK